jgi:putative metallohydrolase (TIGR04338 family)
MSNRDFQQSKVYSAEHQLQWLYDNVGGNINLHGVPLQLEPERKFEDLAAVQRYVDLVTLNPNVIGAFGKVGHVHVRERRGDTAAHYRLNTIAINTKATKMASGSGWALRETVVLHELAHHYSKSHGHGPDFARTFVTLLSHTMGPQVSTALAILYRTGDVKL